MEKIKQYLEQRLKELDYALGYFEDVAVNGDVNVKITLAEIDQVNNLLVLLQSSLQLPYKNEKLIENMCLSYKHNFGLLNEIAQEDLRFECKEWLIAYENNKKQAIV